MKRCTGRSFARLSLVALGLTLATISHAFAQSVFINEIHYDNTGADSGEAIEIAGPADTDLTGWRLVLYNGSGGAAYDTINLTGTIPDQQNGFGVSSFAGPASGIQNGSPDGIALVNASNTVVQFLSYEEHSPRLEGQPMGWPVPILGWMKILRLPQGCHCNSLATGPRTAIFPGQCPPPTHLVR